MQASIIGEPGRASRFARITELAAPIAHLLARLYVAKVFFMAGMSKTGNWESTLSLFEEEYRVPILTPQMAAILGTGLELTLPVLLVIGICTRCAAAGLLMVNGMAVFAYYHVLADMPVALQDHLEWGLLLLLLAVQAPVWTTVDFWWVRARLNRSQRPAG